MLKGSIVALITPFDNGSLSEERLYQINQLSFKNGTNGLFPEELLVNHQLYLITNTKK